MLAKADKFDGGGFCDDKIDQLEKYEGMRVTVETLTAVAPTKGRVDDKTGTAVSDGVFLRRRKGNSAPVPRAGNGYLRVGFASEKEKNV